MFPMLRALPLALLLVAACDAAASPIYRCASASGVTYQERPCAGASRETAWKDFDFPPVNVAERERLLQREAALDARALKRAEIEAAERIARDTRRARELELAAEQERARTATPEIPYAIPVFIRPHRAWAPRPRPILPRY